MDVSWNAGTVYWMDIFHIHICCQICNVFEKDKNKWKKRPGLAHLKKFILWFLPRDQVRKTPIDKAVKRGWCKFGIKVLQ